MAATQTPDSPSPTPRPPEPRLLYAEKSGRTVTVKALALGTRAEETLFTYEERQPAQHSGNSWEEQPPSIALASATGLLAYGAVDGLHVYDLRLKATTTLIKRVREGGDGDSAPIWAPELEGVYGFHNLAWSGNGRYVSFEQSHYEGSTIGFFDLSTNRVFSQEPLPVSYAGSELTPASWAAEGASTIVSMTGIKSGVFLSEPDDPSRAKLVQPPHQYFGAARLSPDASHVAFLFDDDPDGWEATGIAIMRRDGSGLRTIDGSDVKSSVTFDAAGHVWWTERGILYRWDGSSKTIAARADDSFEWEIVGVEPDTVSLTGRSEKAARGLFLLLDRRTGNAIATHGVPTDFVRHLGIV